MNSALWRTPHTTQIAIVLVIPAVIFAIYHTVLTFDFISFDDPLYVTNNPMVLKGWSVEGITWAFSTFTSGNWHPLTWLSHMTDVSLFGLNPGLHHFTNVIFHSINALLLYFLLRKLTGSVGCALVTSVIFAIHPLHLQSVVWVSERKDMLSAMFLLIALLTYTNYCRKPKVTNYLLVLLPFILGLMSKVSIVTFPVLLLLLDFWPLRRFTGSNSTEQAPGVQALSPARLLVEKVPFFIISLVFGILAIVAQRSATAVVPLDILPLQDRLTQALIAYGWYLEKSVIPLDLAIFYPYYEHSITQILLTAVTLTTISITTIVLRHKLPYLIVGWLWFLVSILPVAGLLKVGNQPYADRYTYIAYIGLSLAIIWLLRRSCNVVFAASITLAATALLGMISSREIAHWKNDNTLYTHAVAAVPSNPIAHLFLAGHYFDTAQFVKARQHYEQVIRLGRSDALAWNALGSTLIRLGFFEDANKAFAAAIQVDPGNADANFNLAKQKLQRGDRRNAYPTLLLILETSPTHVPTLSLLGELAYLDNNYDLAVDYYTQALNRHPRDASLLYNLGITFEKLSRPQKAKELLIQARSLNPQLSESINRRLENIEASAAYR